MSKRDNPRRLQREAEKQQKREQYFKAKKTKGDRAAGGSGAEVGPAAKGGKGGFGKSGLASGSGRNSPGGGFERNVPGGAFGRHGAESSAHRGSRGGFGHDGHFSAARETEPENANFIIGRNPVMEAVKSGRQIEKLIMQKDGEGSVRKIASLARERKIQIQYVDRIALDKLCPGRPHQGVAAFTAAHDYCEVEDILRAAREKGEEPFVILLDGLEDPHNLGAIMRTADAAGAHGIIIPGRRAVGLTETVAKASAGAIEYVPVAKVGNIAAAIDTLKEEGLWIAACDMGGETYYDANLSGPVGIVVGGEGQGVGRLVREKCDFVLSIPMKGAISSLNASNAAAILMYEVFRRRAGAKQEG